MVILILISEKLHFNIGFSFKISTKKIDFQFRIFIIYRKLIYFWTLKKRNVKTIKINKQFERK